MHGHNKSRHALQTRCKFEWTMLAASVAYCFIATSSRLILHAQKKIKRNEHNRKTEYPKPLKENLDPVGFVHPIQLLAEAAVKQAML